DTGIPDSYTVDTALIAYIRSMLDLFRKLIDKKIKEIKEKIDYLNKKYTYIEDNHNEVFFLSGKNETPEDEMIRYLESKKIPRDIYDKLPTSWLGLKGLKKTQDEIDKITVDLKKWERET